VENTPDSFRFTQDLSLGVRHPEVQKLQQFLNTRGFTVSLSGPGSAGNETTYFGLATQSAVAAFQEAYRDDILTPFGLTTPTGQFRKRSMEKANALLAEMS
jgi:peptidoglycan hydrolase-like protein with peptidoglycan-binding domain